MRADGGVALTPLGGVQEECWECCKKTSVKHSRSAIRMGAILAMCEMGVCQVACLASCQEVHKKVVKELLRKLLQTYDRSARTLR